MASRSLLALVAVAFLAAALTGLAYAERSQYGSLIVSLDGDVSPLKLPRDRLVPVSVHFSGGLRTEDGSTLPRVNSMELALAGRGAIFNRGLPVCPARRIRHVRSGRALRRCGPALVGHGRLEASVLVPGQAPFQIKARILVFNGRARGGRNALLLHGYTARPPTVVVVPFLVHQRPGQFHTVLTARLPRDLGPWPRIANFEMTISRRFRYRGMERGFVMASCPLPPRFTAGFLNVARVTYTLADGGEAGTEIVRSCRAR